MAIPRIINTQQSATVALTSNDLSLTVNAAINVSAADSYGIDATAGVGGGITVWASVTGGFGICDLSTTHRPYEIVIHSSSVVTATTGDGIKVTQGGSNVVNHGQIKAQNFGVNVIGFGKSV